MSAGFGVAAGGVNEAIAELTEYRRKIRRQNEDDEKLNIVFNDYMNCLMGDPTEEKEKAIIDKAAAMGCEYYCLDCGWYDKGAWWDRVGEWKESPERFPNTLKAVCDYVKEKGMVMGLWVLPVSCLINFRMTGSSAVMESAILITGGIFWISGIRRYANTVWM